MTLRPLGGEGFVCGRFILIMHLLYVDESYLPGQAGWAVVGGVSFFEGEWAKIYQLIGEVVRRNLPDFPFEVEFKARDLLAEHPRVKLADWVFAEPKSVAEVSSARPRYAIDFRVARGDKRNKKKKGQAVSAELFIDRKRSDRILDNLITILLKSNLRIFMVASWVNNYEKEGSLLMLGITRLFDLYLKFLHETGYTQKGLLVFDSLQPAHRNPANTRYTLGIIRYFGEKARWGLNVVGAYTALSHESRPIQLADVLVGLSFRALNATLPAKWRNLPEETVRRKYVFFSVKNKEYTSLVKLRGSQRDADINLDRYSREPRSFLE